MWIFLKVYSMVREVIKLIKLENPRKKFLGFFLFIWKVLPILVL
jgi:hypothetical protein